MTMKQEIKACLIANMVKLLDPYMTKCGFKVPDRGSGNPKPLGGLGMPAERRRMPTWNVSVVSWPGAVGLGRYAVVGR